MNTIGKAILEVGEKLVREDADMSFLYGVALASGMPRDLDTLIKVVGGELVAVKVDELDNNEFAATAEVDGEKYYLFIEEKDE